MTGWQRFRIWTDRAQTDREASGLLYGAGLLPSIPLAFSEAGGWSSAWPSAARGFPFFSGGFGGWRRPASSPATFRRTD